MTELVPARLPPGARSQPRGIIVVCDRLEAAISQAVEGARTVIHVEPENKAKRHNAHDAVRI